jgi:hypothetical protein
MIGNMKKEEIKNDIKNFLDNRFIPKFAPKSKNETYEIIEMDNVFWEIKLPKDEIEITFYFFGKEKRTIQMEIDLPNNKQIDMGFNNNLDDIYNQAIKEMIKHQIKNIFNNTI